MSIAVVPGSFDPITLGHLDITRRAAALFGRVVIAVGTGSAKTPFLPLDRRLDLARQAVADDERIEVRAIGGLLVDLCRELGDCLIIKGLRSGTDLEHETPMALANRQLADIETVFLPASPTWAHVSSSIVREIARAGGDVAAFVPPGVARVLAELSPVAQPAA